MYVLQIQIIVENSRKKGTGEFLASYPPSSVFAQNEPTPSPRLALPHFTPLKAAHVEHGRPPTAKNEAREEEGATQFDSGL